ncbi:hypothetical protein SAMN05216296_1281 [Pseudomonas pohangensis]|jgi:molecular chaperone DnaK (HSP70)|uniref:Coiled coil domain-containing protein n=1 Tax=Pseudomonas pohangensis TaxID=364197 RepID=A0A1H2F328_9PSED|nr:hypothetical protein [Pseudomonas pohangensis]SDU01737.1 hypothetical protein SAMN05216296_1281 [Pseudomonas pohangensis]
MSIKDNLTKKLESQIELWNKQLESLTADAEKEKAEAENQKASAELKLNIANALESLKSNINEANQAIAELKDAGEGKVNDMKAKLRKWLE